MTNQQFFENDFDDRSIIVNWDLGFWREFQVSEVLVHELCTPLPSNVN